MSIAAHTFTPVIVLGSTHLCVQVHYTVSVMSIAAHTFTPVIVLGSTHLCVQVQ